MHKHTRSALKIAIVVLLTLSLIALVTPFAKYFMIATYSERVTINEIKNVPAQALSDETIHPPTFSDALTTLQKNNLDAIGQVVIPKIEVSQPILVGMTNENMVRGVISLFPERSPNKSSLTLIGHNVINYNWGNSLLFGAIGQLESSDYIYVRHLGREYTYQVENNVVIKETDINRLADKGSDYLMLVTCNEPTTTSHRILVTAKKIQSINNNKSVFQEKLKETEKAKSVKYRRMVLIPLLILLAYLIFIIIVWRM